MDTVSSNENNISGRRLKIAFILPHFYPYVGGAEKLFYDLAVALAKKGHRVHVVAEEVDGYKGKMEFDGIKVWYCPWKSMFGHPFPRRKDMERHIKWCNVVHTSTFTTSPGVSALAKKYRKPSVITIHEMRGVKWFMTDVWYKACIYFAVEQYTSRQHFDIYHAVSDATAKDIRTFAGKRKGIRRVYPANETGMGGNTDEAFSLRKYFGVKREKIFLYYGRPGKTKGIQVFEKALKLLKDKGELPSGVRFCFILGAEPADLRKAFIKEMKAYGLGDVVKIRPSLKREQLAAAIKQADAVVVPSLTEGFGFSALEACQSGAKLICSDAGSLPEVVFGECAVFKSGDEAELAEILKKAGEGDMSVYRNIPEKRFTYEAFVGGIEDIYEEIVK